MFSPCENLYIFEPMLPIDALGISARKYSSELAQEFGAPENMVACTLIAMFAASQVGANCFVSKNFQIGMSMNMGIGAHSGASKSPCESRQRKVLEELIDKHILLSSEDKRLVLAKREILEEKRKKIKKKSSKAIDEKKSEEYAKILADIDNSLEQLIIPVSPMMGNMSIPSFVEELSIRNGRGIRSDSEGGILAQLDTVNSTKLTPFLDVWSNDSVEDITKKRQVRIIKTYLVNFTMWQIEPLCKILRNNDYIDNGYVARWLIHIEYNWQPRKGCGCVSDQSEDWYKSQLERALLFNMQNMVGKTEVCNYCLANDARIVLSQFKECVILAQAKDQIYADYQDIAMKLDVQAVRIAMALAAMEVSNDISGSNLMIDDNIMRKACCLALYFANVSVNMIANGVYDALKKEALPIIKYIDAIQHGNMFNQLVTTNELSDATGYSKSKCRRLLYWMALNRWICPAKQNVLLSFGKSEEQEGWIPQTFFKNL